jgi:hypothetical protein
MQASKRAHLSRLRQSLRRLAYEIESLLPVFMETTALVKGTVYEQRRKCGKPTCACATGKPHSTNVLSRSEGGRTRLMTIPSGRLVELRILTKRYRRFRRSRARMVEIHKKMITLINELETVRRQDP